MILICFIFIAIFVIIGYRAYNKARKFQQRPKSLSGYYSILTGVLSLIAALGAWLMLKILGYFYQGFHLSSLITIIVVFIVESFGLSLSQSLRVPTFDARACFEKIVRILLASASILSVLITLSIVLTLLFETLQFFKKIPLKNFLFELHWNPQTSYTSDTQIVDYGLYGAVPLFAGTFLIMTIALLIAAPTGLLIAVYMREYAPHRIRYLTKSMIEFLAGIPTIVYGFFALVAVMPFLQGLGDWMGVDICSQSALGVGIVMGIMIIPYVSSLSDDALNTVPQSMRDNSLALGATTSETIKKVVIPAAAPGIITAILLGISRALGETMLVVMAAGLTPNLTLNPFEAVTTVTVQIVSLLTGDQEFDSPKTLSAFALGLTLFLLTLVLNIISRHLIKRHRDKYDA